jgi:putative transposase
LRRLCGAFSVPLRRRCTAAVPQPPFAPGLKLWSCLPALQHSRDASRRSVPQPPSAPRLKLWSFLPALQHSRDASRRSITDFLYIYSCPRDGFCFYELMNETNWHHAPLHRFVPGGIHMVTGATLDKAHFFKEPGALSLFQDVLLNTLDAHGWVPHAWACLSNHYHFIAKAPEEGDLTRFLQTLHSQLGLRLNDRDHTPGRRVMYQFWDRGITHDSSYYARLKYVMNNPVKHGLVEDACLYSWCSAAWFHENHASPFRRRVMSYGIERVNELDDF